MAIPVNSLRLLSSDITAWMALDETNLLYKFVYMKMSWDNARKFCESHGGNSSLLQPDQEGNTFTPVTQAFNDQTCK